jgi:CBS domain-containing protein
VTFSWSKTAASSGSSPTATSSFAPWRPGLDLDRTTVGEIGTPRRHRGIARRRDHPGGPVDERHSIRRLPVCDGGHPIGVISLGDIAVEFGGDRLADMQRPPQAVLADISEAPPNR